MLAVYLSMLETEEEKDKFECMYRSHKETMKVVAIRILQNDVQAEDAVHDAFLKLTRHMDAVGEVDSRKTKSYVCATTRTIALDMIRKSVDHPTVSIETLGNIESEASDMLGKLAAGELLDIIKELPDIYQDILELKAYQNISDKEIADILDVSAATVRKRLQRARMMLMDKMEKRGGNYAYTRV